jgi:hypothetical protein
MLGGASVAAMNGRERMRLTDGEESGQDLRADLCSAMNQY